MKWPALASAVAGALLLSFVVGNTLLPHRTEAEPRQYHHFEVTLSSTISGTAQLFYNAGRRFNETDSARVLVAPGGPARLRFRLDATTVRDLRFDPIDGEGTITLEDALVRRPDGTVLRRFAPEDFRPDQQIAGFDVQGEKLTLRTPPGANDPTLLIALHGRPLELPADTRSKLWPLFPRAVPGLIVVAAGLALGFAVRRWRPDILSPVPAALARWSRERPRTLLAAAVALGVILSCYPVVFGGASFVSPNYGTTLLYDGYPTLPGYRDTRLVDPRAADVGAIMWQHVPLSVVQRRAWLEHGELPLWNRYNSAGLPLLGQGQLMVGDPLQLLVILAGGNAWAWDLKYLAAKWLAGFGLGLIVLRLAGSLPAALLVGFASMFTGFFVYRLNHPAFFTFCYAPWILYAWCRLAEPGDRRRAFGAWLGLIAANALVMVSGTAKEAYVSLLTMNFAGAALLLSSELSAGDRWRRLGAAAAAGGVLLLLTAPVWLTFLDTIRSSYSSYNEQAAYQLQPSLLLALFDESLLRPLWDDGRVFNPAANFVLLAGVLAFFAQGRALFRQRVPVGLCLGALLPLAFVFGFVPPFWIASWPFLGNIHHIDNSFGVGLVHLVTVMAGLGFATALRRWREGYDRSDLVVMAVLFGALVFLYVGFTQAVHRSTHTFLHWGETLSHTDFSRGYFLTLLAALPGGVLLFHRAWTHRRLSLGAGLALLACVIALLWRGGMHAASAFPHSTLNAAPRVDLLARSPALEALRRDQREPGRVIGLNATLSPGWSGVYDLEGVNGPDALMNPHYRELQEAFGVERVWDWRLVFTAENLAAAQPFLNLLNVRHVLAPAAAPLALPAVASADLVVHRNEAAWPRAFFTDRVVRYARAADFAGLVRQASGPLAAVQERDRLPAPLTNLHGDGRVVPARNYTLTNNTTSFEVEAPGPGVIVLAEAWMPRSFSVSVNGRAAECLRVNHAFRGVVVDRAGPHRISFTYRPPHWWLSLGLSGVALAICGLGYRWCRPAQSSH
jgi:hypothetical protein